MKILILLLAMIHIAFAVPNIELSWDANPEADMSHYIVKVGTAADNMVQVAEVRDGKTKVELTLPYGIIHYATVIAVNTSDLQSEPSKTLVFQVFRPGDGTAPSKPVNVRKTASMKVTIETSPDLMLWSAEYSYVAELPAGDDRRFWRMVLADR